MYAYCTLGTDCADCGTRYINWPPPPSAPPAPPAMPPAPPGSLRISPDCPEWYDPVNYLYPFCARVG